ncbi:MAG: hypothetical protein QOF54_1932 [Solirubrobacteraceae bacterium]|jgi:hypothetical protein|nr:hypothetical protein [Solirubrobacteraceae bacterium]
MRQSSITRPRATRKTRYGSLSSFYLADPRRVRSRERDIGLWWREDLDGPLHRAAWVTDTGELYLVRLGPADAGGGEVELLAVVADREQLERALTGWRERCGDRRSLAWLRTRARTLAGAGAARAQPGGSRLSGERRVGRGGAMAATMSSVASELSYTSRPRTSRPPRAPRRSTARLASSSPAA